MSLTLQLNKPLLLHSETEYLLQSQTFVTHPTGQFPNETYLNGLRDNPGSTLAVVYDEFRMPIIQAIKDQGAPEEEGALCFQLAVNDAARLAHSGALPQGVHLFDYLKALSIAQYTTWLGDQNPDPSTEEGEEEAASIPPVSDGLPGPDQLRTTRNKVSAWQKLQHLTPDCRQLLLEKDRETEIDSEADASEGGDVEGCKKQYLLLLGSEESPMTSLPEWANAALQDTDGYAIWLRTDELEKEWVSGDPVVPESNRIWRWAVGVLLLVAVGYGAFQFYFRPKTAAEVFADNFAPPSSLIEDMGTRYDLENREGSDAQPDECVLLLREADAYYKAKEFLAAQDPLLLIVMDSSSVCQSDAWYFLGILQIQLEDPTTAIQCFAKIEDLERYGEDLYWYQALAFVQLAKENPLMRDKARRAVDRMLGNTRDPERKAQAEVMLKNLSK